MIKTKFVLPLFEEELIDTQIKGHRVTIRQRSKASIHMSFFFNDAVFTRILAYNLIQNEILSIKMN